MKTVSLILLIMITFLPMHELRAEEESYEPRFRIEKEGKFGYIDQKGEIVIQPQFKFCHDFHEGLAGVLHIGMWGFIDTDGQFSIPALYSDVSVFSEGLAAVRQSNKAFYIDRTGKQLGETTYDETAPFSDGLGKVKVGGLYGFIDASGMMVIPPTFADAGNFHEGFCVIDNKDNSGAWFIDKSGKQAFKEKFDSANDFHDGFAVVERNGKFGYIDQSGGYMITPKLINAGDFSEGMAALETESGKSVVINTRQEKLFITEYKLGFGFHDGLISVNDMSSNNGFGFMNAEGKLVIPFQFKGISVFAQGLCKVDGPIQGYINKQGEYVWEDDTTATPGMIDIEPTPLMQVVPPTRPVQNEAENDYGDGGGTPVRWTDQFRDREEND